MPRPKARPPPPPKSRPPPPPMTVAARSSGPTAEEGARTIPRAKGKPAPKNATPPPGYKKSTKEASNDTRATAEATAAQMLEVPPVLLLQTENTPLQKPPGLNLPSRLPPPPPLPPHSPPVSRVLSQSHGPPPSDPPPPLTGSRALKKLKKDPEPLLKPSQNRPTEPALRKPPQQKPPPPKPTKSEIASQLAPTKVLAPKVVAALKIGSNLAALPALNQDDDDDGASQSTTSVNRAQVLKRVASKKAQEAPSFRLLASPGSIASLPSPPPPPVPAPPANVPDGVPQSFSRSEILKEDDATATLRKDLTDMQRENKLLKAQLANMQNTAAQTAIGGLKYKCRRNRENGQRVYRKRVAVSLRVMVALSKK